VPELDRDPMTCCYADTVAMRLSPTVSFRLTYLIIVRLFTGWLYSQSGSVKDIESWAHDQRIPSSSLNPTIRPQFAVRIAS
jgi:hypothetical protein